MKSSLVFFFVIVLFCSFAYADEWCYQETANVSTACGGLDTGSYTENGYDNKGIWYYLPSGYDGNWDSQSSTCTSGGCDSSVDIIYYKPSNSNRNNSLWKVKDGVGTENLTITQGCWEHNADYIKLRMRSYYIASNDMRSYWYCDDGSWITLRSNTGANLIYKQIYEDAMWWYDANHEISFVDPTPADETTTTNNYIYVNVSVSDASNTTALIDWNRSLVGWWRFNEGSGTVAEDFSSWGNNGTLTNMDNTDWVDGKYGNALNFDGVNDYVDCGGNTFFSKTTGDTITGLLWFKPASFTTINNLIGKGTGSFGRSNYNFYTNISTGYISFNFRNSANTESIVYSTTDPVVVGYWSHLYFTHTYGDNTSTKIYHNGNQVSGLWSGDGSSAPHTNTAYPLTIGMTQNIGRHTNGTIDEVRIHNRALSAEEINASYNSGLHRLYHNFTNLEDGTYTYIAYAQDLAGNVNQTETRTIYITSEIDSCQTLGTNNQYYILNTSISNSPFDKCMNVTATGVTLDCQGHTIDGTDTASTYGIYISESALTNTDFTLKNCTLTDWNYGMYVVNGTNNTILDSTADSNTESGFEFTTSYGNEINDTTANSNTYGFAMYENCNGLKMNNCTANLNADAGYYLWDCNNSEITESTASSNAQWGLVLDSTHLSTLHSNILENNTDIGLWFYDNSENNTIYYNSISDSTACLHFENAANGNPTNNQIYNNLINCTTHLDYTNYAASLDFTAFLNTTIQAGTRIYSSGSNIGGNYWAHPNGSGYSETCTDYNNNSFCDTAYNLSTTLFTTYDYLPLSDSDVCAIATSGNWTIDLSGNCSYTSENINIDYWTLENEGDIYFTDSTLTIKGLITGLPNNSRIILINSSYKTLT